MGDQGKKVDYFYFTLMWFRHRNSLPASSIVYVHQVIISGKGILSAWDMKHDIQYTNQKRGPREKSRLFLFHFDEV